MKMPLQAARLPVAATVMLLASGSCAFAQTAPAAAPAAAPAVTEDEVVVLSPFVVTSGDTADGYQVKDTLGGTRVRTDMSDVASSISVVSKKLLDDAGITNAQQLLVYTTNTEVSGLNGSFSGVSSRGSGVQNNAESGRLTNPNMSNRARGISAMDNTRNYFLSEIPWDSYNIDRVDISRGPNSFLFGVGSPAGISNNSTVEAVWKDKGALEFRYGSYGTTRESLDFNKVLLPDELAVRLDLLNDNTKYRQKPAYNHSSRVYGALRYDPKFLNSGSANTFIKINAEAGRVRSNNPRILPPLDYISGYFDGVVNKAGYDPFDYSGAGNNTQGNPPGLSPWINQGSIHYIWPGPGAAFWFDGKSGELLATRTTLNGANSSGTNTIATGYLASLPQTMAMYTTGFSNYARAVNRVDPTQYQGAYAGTVVYGDKSITDRSVFDFYNNLIDGDNKREWQNWNAFNAIVEQSFFNRRLTFQGTFDHQEFDFGNEGTMSGGMAPYIAVDLNAYNIVLPSEMSGSQVNPNVGRPFMGSDYTASNGSTKIVRDNAQILANGDIRATDFLDSKSTAAKIIGTHSFTLLAGNYQVDTETRTWSMYNTDVPFANEMGDVNGLISSLRGIHWVTYLGDSMVDKTTASGLNLSPMATMFQPTSGSISHFDNTWNRPTDPTATGYVDPNATWINPANPTGVFQENDNPANFVGWTTIPVRVLNSKDNINDLYQSGSKKTEKLQSEAFMYQGTMFDGIVMPMFGYRKDKIRQSSTNATLDPHTQVANLNYNNTGEADVQSTTSKSYGVTLHLPKSLRGKLPFGSDVSLHYFHGANGTPKVRYGFDANQLPNESGKTDDYSVQLDTLEGRVSVRLTYFKTLDMNAAATGGAADPLGGNGYYLYLLPAWGAASAAATGNYIADPTNNGGSFTTVSGTTSATQLQIDAVADWQANIDTVFTQAFFDAYGLGLNLSAIKTGNWSNVFNNPTIYPYPWNIANTGAGHVNGSWPIISQDVEAKGWELEATLRPLKNWDLTFNVSKVDAVQVGLGQSTVDFILQQKEFFDGPAGQLPLWGYWGGSHSPTSTLQYAFYQNIFSAYHLQTAQTGTTQPELAKWSAKAITNYRFTTGFLKDFNVGGAFRWSSKPILGYGISEMTVDGVDGPIWLMDVNKPLKGDVDTHFDLWVGYERKLTEKINWRIQLNVQNVLEKAGLTPVSLEPNGDVAQSRITQGQTWTITNTFKF